MNCSLGSTSAVETSVRVKSVGISGFEYPYRDANNEIMAIGHPLGGSVARSQHRCAPGFRAKPKLELCVKIMADGVNQARHINVNHLLLQEKVKSG